MRTATPAERVTTAPPMMVGTVSSSPRIRAAQAMLNTGCTNCTWLTCAIGPIASPRYHAKKPRNILTTAKYPNAAHSIGSAAGGCWIAEITASGIFAGAAAAADQLLRGTHCEIMP